MSSDAATIAWHLHRSAPTAVREAVRWPETATHIAPPDYGVRLPSDQLGALLGQVERYGGASLIASAGLEAGRHPHTALWLLLRSSSGVRQLATRAAAYWSAFSASTSLETGSVGEHFELVLVNGGRDGDPGFDTLARFAAGALIGVIFQHTRGAPRPDRVTLPSAPDAAALEQVYGTVVREGGDTLRIVYPREVLERTLASRDDLIAGYLEAELQRRLKNFERAFSWQVDELIRRRLPDSIGMRDAARALSLSERTLRRRLEQEGTSYRERLDRVRRAQALEMLAHRDVASVARELGFVEPRSFQRAFRRWMGVSPSRYLRGLRDGI